ncbi:MAG: helix-turn-helix domain-containing protein [Pseudonocardiaceae bacterium]
MAVAAPLTLRLGDRPRLEALARSTAVRAGLAQRARIVLLAETGMANAEIARRTGSTRPTVLAWRNRYAAGGINALRDKPRSGRPAKVDEIAVVAATLADAGKPPEHLGATHWSSRLLADELGISFATVARIWRKWGIQPHRIETFRFGIGSELDTKLDTKMVGLYRNPPERSSVRHPALRALDSASGAERPASHPDPWLRLVEMSLGILTYQAIRLGTFASVHNLIQAIGALTDNWNEREEAIPRRERTDEPPSKDRKASSNTQQPPKQSSKGEKVDLQGGPESAPQRVSGQSAAPLGTPGRAPGGSRAARSAARLGITQSS